MAKVLVERETYEKNGKSYYAYYVKGVIRGRNVRILMVPPDKGGYTVLDIVFGDAMTGVLGSGRKRSVRYRQHRIERTDAIGVAVLHD